jgi:hypothetical protein
MSVVAKIAALASQHAAHAGSRGGDDFAADSLQKQQKS